MPASAQVEPEAQAQKYDNKRLNKVMWKTIKKWSDLKGRQPERQVLESKLLELLESKKAKEIKLNVPAEFESVHATVDNATGFLKECQMKRAEGKRPYPEADQAQALEDLYEMSMTTYAEIIEKCTCERLKSQVQMCQASQKILQKSKVEFKEKMEKSRKEKMVELQKKEEELQKKEEILDKLKKELRQLNDQQHVYQQLGEQRDVSDLGTTGEEELDKMFDNDDQ